MKQADIIENAFKLLSEESKLETKRKRAIESLKKIYKALKEGEKDE